MKPDGEGAEVLADSNSTRCVGPATGRFGLDGGDSSPLVVEFAQCSAAGPLHVDNEDAICCRPSDREILFAIADGVGGYEGGAMASAIALESVLQTWGTALTAAAATSPLKRLRRAVERANLAVYDAGEGRIRTTLTVSVLGPRTLAVAHVGDCRVLRFRDGTLLQLTADHNLAARRAQYGLLAVTELPDDAGRRLLTRSLGQDPYLRIDTLSLDLRPGDWYIQCSDGLATLSGASMIRILVHHEPSAAAELLLQRARQAGGTDDISVQVVRVARRRRTEPTG